MTDPSSSPLKKTVTIVNERGLHARASAKFVKLAEQFAAKTLVSRDGVTVHGTSIMGLLMLGAAPGTAIDIETSGMDAAMALEKLTDLVEDGFGEEK